MGLKQPVQEVAMSLDVTPVPDSRLAYGGTLIVKMAIALPKDPDRSNSPSARDTPIYTEKNGLMYHDRTINDP